MAEEDEEGSRLDLNLVLDGRDGRLARQVAEAIRRTVRRGGLTPGQRLPASRSLAKDLGTARGPVVEAYQQLLAEGYLEARPGAGTFVARRAAPVPGTGAGSGLMRAIERATAVPPALPAPSRIRYDLRPGLGDLSLFPRHAWQRALRHALTTAQHSELSYPPPAGAPRLRDVLAGYLRRKRGALLPPGQLVVTAGSTQAVSAVTRVLLQAGHRRLAVEDPTDVRERQILQAVGLEVVPIPVDQDGLDVERLARSGTRAVLLAPTHHFPTGAVLSPRRRVQLADWARAHDAVIIEDDYDGEFQYERPETGCLQALAPDRVVLVGSVSKSLSPALRLGWAVAPPPLAEAVAVERAITDFGTPTLDQLALAHMLSTGGYARHLRHAARHYRERLRRLLAAVERHIPHARLRGSTTVGLHLCLELPHTDESTLLRTAAGQGVALQSTHAMHLRSPGPGAGTLLALGVGQLPENRVDEAVAALAAALRSSGASPRHTG